MKPSILIGAFAGAAFVAGSSWPSARPASAPLTLQILSDWTAWAGAPPQAPQWSHDGTTIYFTWNPDGAADAALYRVSVAGGSATRVPDVDALVIPPPGPFTPQERAKARNRPGTHVVFERNRDIFLLDARSGMVTRVTNTEAAETAPRFTHDGSRITFELENNLYAYSLERGEIVQITDFRVGPDPQRQPPTQIQQHLADRQLELFETLRQRERTEQERRDRARAQRAHRPAPTYLREHERVTELQLSPDGRFVTFTLVDAAQQARHRRVEVPHYVTGSGYVEFDRRPTTKANDPTMTYRLGILDLSTGRVSYPDSSSFGKPVNWNSVLWSDDGARAVAWAGSQDHKDVWLCLVDTATATTRTLLHDTDDRWVRGFRHGRIYEDDGLAYGFMPDGRSVFFLSERDGWYHLYVVDQSGNVRQLTSGTFDVTQPVLSADGSSWYFLSNESDPGEQQLYAMPADGGQRTRLSPQNGWIAEFTLSADERHIAFLHSSPLEPFELFVMRNQAGERGVRLTTSTTDAFRARKWRTPQYVTFKDKDGWTVHGELYNPARPHPLRPAVIHVHGSGWFQGVTHRFSSYFPESRAEFEFLADNGYTVLNLDYKGSRGYGRVSRVSIYRRMGEPEVESVAAAVDYLVTRYGVDRSRIGLYGHSYGGFVTLMTLLTRPGLVAAGAAQAAPTDFAHTSIAPYTTRILDVPWREPDAYKRSSPITYADRLRDRLLLIHGMLDTPVLFEDTTRFVQRLIELGKTGWDVAIYPLEGHQPRSPASRLDIQRRRFELFETVLKAPRS